MGDQDVGISRKAFSNSLFKYIQGLKGKYTHNDI